MSYEPQNSKPVENFVARLMTADGEKLAVRVRRFRREVQRRESGHGPKYVHQGIKNFSTSERGTGIDGKQFPEAGYWDEKDFELSDLPYITVWLLEVASGPIPDSLENFLRALEAFMSDPEPVPSEFFKRHGTPLNSIECCYTKESS
jgi:hypothetical protein